MTKTKPRGRYRKRLSNRQIRGMVKELDQENRMLRACLAAACKREVERLTADIAEPVQTETAGLPAYSFTPDELAPESRGETYVDEHGEHIVVRWTPPAGDDEDDEEEEDCSITWSAP